MRETPMLVVLLILMLVVAFGVTLLGVRMAAVWLPQDVCAILVYEIDPESSTVRNSEVMKKLLSDIRVRLNTGMARWALVDESEDGKIEVGVLGTDPDMATRIEWLLASPATLEFRILANRPDHEKTIELAQQDNRSDDVRDENNSLLARWVPVRTGYDTAVAAADVYYSPYDGETITRTKVRNNQTVIQVLVILDDRNIDESCLERATATTDHGGQPSIDFQLTAEGGRRLAGLTGKNVPTPMQDHWRSLGTIVDGQLCSNQVIHQIEDSRWAVSGNFTREEAADIATSLNAGPLPVAIRFVVKKKPPKNR